MHSNRVRLKTLIALGAAFVMPMLLSPAQATEVANPHRIVVSKGKAIPVADVSTTVSRSFAGSGEAGGREALSEFPGTIETAQEFAALQALPGISGNLGAETIIGPDNRVRVNPTTSFPARATVLITFSAGRCTGWLIGAPLLIAVLARQFRSGRW